MSQTSELRVSVLGFGAIGRRVAEGIQGGSAPGATLTGIIVRTAGRAASHGYRELDLDTAIAESDLIVECAGGQAVRDLGPRIISGGCDLLVVSVGALADPHLRTTLTTHGPGRTYLSTGAIGGLDLLAAATLDGGLDRAQLTTTKLPATLVQPWMSDTEAASLRAATEPLTVFEGTVQEAIEKFPNSLNVAVALAAATGLWDDTRVRLVADPAAQLTSHIIEAAGSSGEYTFDITNHPLASNPASSGLVSQSLLSGVARLAAPSGRFV